MNKSQTIEWFSFEPPCAGFTPGLVAHDAGYIMGAVEPRYPVPSTIGRISLGTDYPGVFFMDDADSEDPVMIWSFDTWGELNA